MQNNTRTNEMATASIPKLFFKLAIPAALVEYAAWAMRIYMAGIFAFGAQISCQQSFMALGQAKISLFLACLSKIILLIPLIFILPNFFDGQGIWSVLSRAGE